MKENGPFNGSENMNYRSEYQEICDKFAIIFNHSAQVMKTELRHATHTGDV